MGNCIIKQNKIMQMDQDVTKHKKIPEVDAESKGENKVMRIKLVITKQELEMMLMKGGDLASHMIKESLDKAVVIEDYDDNRSCGRWKPVLDSIPEFN